MITQRTQTPQITLVAINAADLSSFFVDKASKVLHERSVTTQDQTYSGSSEAARLPPAIAEQHKAACDARESGYIDPDTGKFVLTSWFLLSQGKCCGKGCRHCPWPAEAQAKSQREDVPAWPDEKVSELARGAYEKDNHR